MKRLKFKEAQIAFTQKQVKDGASVAELCCKLGLPKQRSTIDARSLAG